MPTYDIHFHCSDCGNEHPLLMTIFLTDGPERKQSIAEWIVNRATPPQISAVKRHSAICLKTGRKVSLEIDDKVFLVPRWADPKPFDS
jgi:hypothetical protein